MAIKVIPIDDLNKLECQIKALESIIPKDNVKNKGIHVQALKELKSHRNKLLKGNDLND